MSSRQIGVRDVPIQSLEDDWLQLERYARALAEFISHCEMPITVGIQGDWGSGKTSLMRLVDRLVSEAGDALTIELNTWQYAQYDSGAALPVLLLAGLARKLVPDDTQKRGMLSRAIGSLASIKSVNLSLAGMGGGLELKDDKPGDGGGADIEDLKRGFETAVRKRLQADARSRLVVFIDDLDRVRPERAVEILEVLKNFVDVDRCVFVIACDYQVVVKGLQAKFGFGEGDLGGRSFFDKIIQVPFRMPVHSYDIKKFVGRILGSIDWVVDDKGLDTYIELLSVSVGFNPRSVKRLSNTLLLLRLVAKGEGLEPAFKDPHRMLVLFAIVCLETSYEHLHSELVERAEDAEDLALLLGLRDGEGEDRGLGHRALESLGANERRRGRAFELLKLLGRIVKVDGDEMIDGGEQAVLLEMLRLSAITSVREGSGSKATTKQWSAAEVEGAFAAEGNEIGLSLLEFARKHSADGRVTGARKTQGFAVSFFVPDPGSGRNGHRQLFRYDGGYLNIRIWSVESVFGLEATEAFRVRLSEIFGSDINPRLKKPPVKSERISLEQCEEFKRAVLELLGR